MDSEELPRQNLQKPCETILDSFHFGDSSLHLLHLHCYIYWIYSNILQVVYHGSRYRFRK